MQVKGLEARVTLVVAQKHDGGISLVADTKITYKFDDESRTRKVFEEALPKLMILRDDLVVGITGAVEEALQQLIELRDQPIGDLLETLTSINYASFVVATLDPAPQLWKVNAGSTEERTSIGRCWTGDHDAYEIFQQRYSEWPDKTGSVLRLMSSMQWLLAFDPIPSVGGYLTRVATTSEGFRFVADSVTVGPWFLHCQNQATPDGLTLTFSVPPGGDPNGYQVLPAVGRPPTAGALAYYVPQAGVAWLFCQESPWERVTLKTDSMTGLVESAAENYGQTLVSSPEDPFGPLSL